MQNRCDLQKYSLRPVVVATQVERHLCKSIDPKRLYPLNRITILFVFVYVQWTSLKTILLTIRPQEAVITETIRSKQHLYLLLSVFNAVNDA